MIQVYTMVKLAACTLLFLIYSSGSDKVLNQLLGFFKNMLNLLYSTQQGEVTGPAGEQRSHFIASFHWHTLWKTLVYPSE